MASRNLTAEFKAVVDRVTDQLRDAAIDTLREGAEEAKQNVATRGTAKSGKAGRIETGKMINSIDYEVTGASHGLVEGRFGFRGEPDYTRFQEGGFTHNFSGQWIEGMYATTDAATNAIEKFRSMVARVD